MKTCHFVKLVSFFTFGFDSSYYIQNFICSCHQFFVNSAILHKLTLQRVSIPSSFVILYNALNTLVYLRCCSTGSLWKYIIPLGISVPYKHNVSIQCCSAVSYSSDEICVVCKNSKIKQFKMKGCVWLLH